MKLFRCKRCGGIVKTDKQEPAPDDFVPAWYPNPVQNLLATIHKIPFEQGPGLTCDEYLTFRVLNE